MKQRGFTLIELIIVIIILGILAVTAAPRFFDFGGDARASTINGLAGSMNGASDVVYARSAIEGIEGDEQDTGTYPTTGGGIEIQFGYPAASADGIQAAMNISAGDWDIVVDGDPGDPAAIRFSPAGFNDPNALFADIQDCSVTYTEAVDDVERPVIDILDEDC